MARLIKTETEIEGRFEEVWLVVEEDALEQWPGGPREVVGRPAARADGLARARGQALFTADLRFPGMLHTAVLRSPHARARVARIDLTAALAAPGVRGAIGPGDAEMVDETCEYEGAGAAAVCADTLEQARAAIELIEIEWEPLDAVLDPVAAVEQGSILDTRARERGEVERGLAEADATVSATFHTQTVLHNSMETHQTIARWVGGSLEVHTSTQYIWGVRDQLATA
ncbi:MAG TPA: molybdopterin cofactor-binding domain-containing protein, partial [Gaiellaceae bacterium]|nr:molybdopterin cofactor-binding domain-containing protein [Gaiellaceae bacterium]